LSIVNDVIFIFVLPIEWFTDTVPRKTPYFPQIGDEVVYFRQGHQQYIDTVRDNKIYSINPNIKPYKLRNSLNDEIYGKIIGIKYDVKPPRLVTVKLIVIDHESGEQTNAHFSVCYHDVENVVDFIILKQLYEKSIASDWKVGNEFRSIIDDKWWFGTITCLKECSPFTYFHCFEVMWANGDSESLSPWDLEHINEETVPQNRTESVLVTRDEMNGYNLWGEDEWPECGKIEECHRISEGIMKRSVQLSKRKIK
jgi:bromodomain and WD repeat domain containing protein 1/3